MRKLEEIELFAFLGEDEYGSGEIGIKQAAVRTGVIIPMTAINRAKLEQYWPQIEAQVAAYGKTIYLCRFTFAEIVRKSETGHGFQ